MLWFMLMYVREHLCLIVEEEKIIKYFVMFQWGK